MLTLPSSRLLDHRAVPLSSRYHAPSPFLPLPIQAHPFFIRFHWLWFSCLLWGGRCLTRALHMPGKHPTAGLCPQPGGRWFPSLTWGLFHFFLPRNYCWLSSFKHSFLREDTQCSDFSTISRSFLETPVHQSLSISVRSRKQGKHIGFMDGNLKATWGSGFLAKKADISTKLHDPVCVMGLRYFSFCWQEEDNGLGETVVCLNFSAVHPSWGSTSSAGAGKQKVVTRSHRRKGLWQICVTNPPESLCSCVWGSRAKNRAKVRGDHDTALPAARQCDLQLLLVLMQLKLRQSEPSREFICLLIWFWGGRILFL